MATVFYSGRTSAITDRLGQIGGTDGSIDLICRRVITHELIEDSSQKLLKAVGDGADWLAVTSVTTAKYLAPIWPRLAEIAAEKSPNLRLATTGAATSAALRKFLPPSQIEIGLEARQPASAKTLAAGFAEFGHETSLRILLPVSARSDSWLTDQLTAGGHRVERIDLYQTFPDEEAVSALSSIWQTISVAVLTSPSSVSALQNVLEAAPWHNDLPNPEKWPVVVAIGEKTSAALSKLKLPHLTCPAVTPDAVADTVADALNRPTAPQS